MGGNGSFMGNELCGKPAFCIGAVANPGATDLQAEIDNTLKKLDAGAEFFQTQAIYDVGAFEKFISRAKITKPILAGVIPIKSVKMAQYMNEKIPGVNIPGHLLKRIADAGDDKQKVAGISIDIASNTIAKLRDIAEGVHVMAIGWEDKIPQILRNAGI